MTSFFVLDRKNRFLRSHKNYKQMSLQIALRGSQYHLRTFDLSCTSVQFIVYSITIYTLFLVLKGMLQSVITYETNP
jgi:hypothetical protein